MKKLLMKSMLLGFGFTLSATSFGGLPNRDPAIPPRPLPPGVVPLAPDLLAEVCYDRQDTCNGLIPGAVCGEGMVCIAGPEKYRISTPIWEAVVYKCFCGDRFGPVELPEDFLEPQPAMPIDLKDFGESILVPETEVKDVESKEEESQDHGTSDVESK